MFNSCERKGLRLNRPMLMCSVSWHRLIFTRNFFLPQNLGSVCCGTALIFMFSDNCFSLLNSTKDWFCILLIVLQICCLLSAACFSSEYVFSNKSLHSLQLNTPDHLSWKWVSKLHTWPTNVFFFFFFRRDFHKRK